MENFIEVVQSVVLPIVTLVLGYFGWRANADKNKLKAELKSLEHSNISKEIENQSSWLDLYKKLHNDQAERITQAMGEIEQLTGEIDQLKRIINKFEHAFKKTHSCIYFESCPIRDELSKLKDIKRKGKQRIKAGTRQREPSDKTDDTGNSHTTDEGDPEC